MPILAIDTTTARESAALVEQGAVRGEVRLLTSDSHSRQLVPAIAFLLSSSGVAPGDVEGYAVTTGPGSFTGLRVGLSTVQGLALASGRPCLGLSALDVLAARIAGAASHLVPLMEAYRGEVFTALYDAEGRPLGEPLVTLPEPWLRALPEGCAFIGDAVERHRALIVATCAGASFPQRGLFLAGTLGRLAEPLLREGRGIAPEALRPLYLREAAVRGHTP